MKKYRIYWDAGYGKNFDDVEVESDEKAINLAFEACQEDASSNWDYGIAEEDDE